MSEEKGFKPVLPPDFDGVFRFTNWTKQDFSGTWGKKEYLFPAMRTTPMIIPEHSPVEIQNIRKKFAKDLAEREFFKSKEYKLLADQEGKPGNRTMTGIHQAGQYSIDDLAKLIQKGLEPLEGAQSVSQDMNLPKVEDKLTRDEEGSLRTEAVDPKKSLVQKALSA